MSGPTVIADRPALAESESAPTVACSTSHTTLYFLNTPGNYVIDAERSDRKHV